MLRFTFKSMGKRLAGILMVTIVGMVSLMLVSMSIYIYENSIYCKNAISSIMKEKVENSAVVAIMSSEANEEFKKSNAFRNVLVDMPEISAAGYSQYTEGLSGCEYDRVQRELNGGRDGEFCYLYIESGAMGLYNIELEEGEIVKDMPYGEGLNYVYLGSGFMDYYSIGDESELKITDDIHYKFVVKGFFKDGIRIVDNDEVEDTASFLGDKCYYTLGPADVIIESNAGGLDNTMLCSWEDGHSFEEMKQKILDKAKECGLECIVADMSEIIKEKGRSTREINGYILNVLGVILATTVIMMVCIQITSILNNMPEYGILYANGFRTANIAFMLVAECVARMAVSSVVSLVLVRKLLTAILYIVPEEEEVFMDIFGNYVVWGNIGAAAVMGMVSLVIPLIFVSRLKPVQLIGGNDT